MNEPIAIIGLAGRFPGAPTVARFWEKLRRGESGITRFSDEELLQAGIPPDVLDAPEYVKARGIIDDVAGFDAKFFGFSPREADITDPQQRIFLESCWEALEDAAYAPARFGGRIGVFGGSSWSTYFFDIYSRPDVWRALGGFQIAIGNEKDHLTTRVSYKLNLRGPSVTVQTACSSSLVAVSLACQSLAGGECDLALAGGVSISLPQEMGYFYEEGGILCPDGYCRAFDAEAKGTVGGNGVGVVVLKRLAAAVADGDHIRAVIRGVGINNDGSGKVGYTAPGITGQAEAIAAAHARANVSPESISYVEAHGTGTPLGDPIEIAALTDAFRRGTDRVGYCAIGSVKTNIGHLDAAAGVAGLIKTTLALEHRTLPPSLHFKAPNPVIPFATSPFFVNTESRPWEANGTPRRAGVSSFGIGGTNAHVVLEEAPPLPPADPPRGECLLVLSAQTETALEKASENLAAHLEAHPDASLADVAFTLQNGRTEMAYRRALVCSDAAEAVRELRRRDAATTGVRRENAPRVAFLYDEHGLAEQFVPPAIVVGHGAGEIMAACAAGVFAPEDARKLLAERERLLHDVPRGKMLAVPLPDEQVRALAGDTVDVAAIDAADRTVVSGTPAAIDRCALELRRHGIECRPLRASQALHSRAMDAIVEPFVKAVAQVPRQAPRIPILSGVTGGWLDAATATDPAYWGSVLRQPVRFFAALGTLLQEENLALLGDALVPLAERHPARRAEHLVVPATPPLAALGKLWIAGARVQWDAVTQGQRRRRVPLPTYPFERRRHWIDPAPEDEETLVPPRPRAGKRSDPAEWLYVPSWTRRPARLGAETPPRSWLFVADRSGVAEALAARFTAAGARVAVARDGREAAALVELHAPEAIAHFSGLDEVAPAEARPAVDGFHDLLQLALAVKDSATISVVATGLFEVTGHERLAPAKAALLGACKVVPQERPQVRFRLIDVAADPSLDALQAELAAPLDETVVALRGRHRWVQTYEPWPVQKPGAPLLRRNGCWFITGGRGRIGSLIAGWLRRTVDANVVLVGRSPAEEAHPDSHVLSLAADAADAEAMRHAIEQARARFGRIDGVVHAAGLTAEDAFAPAEETDRELVARHFAPKAHALEILDELLRDDPPDLWLLTSSLSAVLGGLGMAAYAGANAFMDAYAVRRNAEGPSAWLSVNFDGWDFREGGEPSPVLTPSDGLDVLERLLGSRGPAQVVVSCADLQAKLEQWIELRSLRAQPGTVGPRGEMLRVRGQDEPSGDDVAARIGAMWTALLGVPSIGPEDDFFQLGGHSLLAIQLISRLRDAFHIEVPVHVVFNHPTLAQLAAHVESVRAAEETARLEKMVALVEGLSDEEIQALLREGETR